MYLLQRKRKTVGKKKNSQAPLSCSGTKMATFSICLTVSCLSFLYVSNTNLISGIILVSYFK